MLGPIRTRPRRGTAPNIIMIEDERTKTQDTTSSYTPFDDPNIDLDNLQRGARSISMTYGSVKGVQQPYPPVRDLRFSSVGRSKARLFELKNECREPIMWELNQTFSHLAKNKQRIIVNFEYNRFDVESIEATFRKMGTEDISIENTLMRYPKAKLYYETQKANNEANQLQGSAEGKEDPWENDTDTERRCYYPVLKPRYERPRLKKNTPVVEQSKNKSNQRLNQSMQERSKPLSPVRAKVSENTLELPSNVSSKSLKSRSFTSMNAGNSENTRIGLNTEKSNEGGEFKTFVLTAMDPDLQTMKSEGKEEVEKKVEVKEVKEVKEEKKLQIKTANGNALEPLKEHLINIQKGLHSKHYDKVKKIQNEIIKQNNFSQNYEKSLRTQFERLLSNMSGKQTMGKRHTTLAATLRKEVASMPATYKLY